MTEIKLNVQVSTNKQGSETKDVITVEIPDDCSEDEKEKLLNEAAWEWAIENIDYGYSEI